jgi:hypothetical protein
MEAERSPSAIVMQMLEVAGTLERWADAQRTANLAEHEQAVLSIFSTGTRSGVRRRP